MVERYRQPGLPSPVVGTPGVNKAAGAAAAEASKVSEQMTNEQFAAARNIGRSAGQVQNAIGNAVSHVNAVQQQVQSRQAGIALAKKESDINNTYAGLSAGLHQEYGGNADDPLRPAQVTDTSKDVYNRQFEAYSDEAAKSKNPYYQEGLVKLAAQYRDHYTNSETTWVGQRTLANLSNITATAGVDAAKQIQSIPGVTQPPGAPIPGVQQPSTLVPIASQVKQALAIKSDMNRVFDETGRQSEEMGKQYPTIAEHGVAVRKAQVEANYAVNKTLWDKFIAQPPNDPKEAMDYMRALQNLADTAPNMGLEVKDPEALNKALDTGFRSAETDAIAINHASIEKSKIENLNTKMALNDAIYAGDEDAAGKLLQTNKESLGTLQGTINYFEGLPAGRLKTQGLNDLYGLKSQLVTLSGQDIRAQMAMVKAAQAQEKAAVRTATATEKRLALEEHAQAKTDFDDRIQGFRLDSDAAFQTPIGPDQSNAMAQIVDNAVKAIDEAQTQGTINSDKAKRYTDEFQARLNKTDYVSGLSLNIGGIQIGQPYRQAVTPQDRLKQVQEHRSHLGQVQQMQMKDDGYYKILNGYVESSLAGTPVKAEARSILSSELWGKLSKARATTNPKTGKAYTEAEIEATLPRMAAQALERAQQQIDSGRDLPRIKINASEQTVSQPVNDTSNLSPLNPISKEELKKGVHMLTTKEAKAMGLTNVPPPPAPLRGSPSFVDLTKGL